MSSMGLLHSITQPRSLILIVILCLVSLGDSTEGSSMCNPTNGSTTNTSMGECSNAGIQLSATRGLKLLGRILKNLTTMASNYSERQKQSMALCMIHDYHEKATELEQLLSCEIDPKSDTECKELQMINKISAAALCQFWNHLYKNVSCDQLEQLPDEIARMCLNTSMTYSIVGEVYEATTRDLVKKLVDDTGIDCWMKDFTEADVQDWAKKKINITMMTCSH